MKLDIHDKIVSTRKPVDVSILTDGYYLIRDTSNTECIILLMKSKELIFFIDKDSDSPTYITMQQIDYLMNCELIKKIDKITWS